MRVSEIMTTNPVVIDASTPVIAAAEEMRNNDIGDLVVRKDGQLCGIVTDRDIVVRVLASGKGPKTTKVDVVCSHELLTVAPDQDTADAVKLMRERAIRRLPAVQGDRVVGIVSLGDLAVALDRRSALGHISAARANQ